MNPALERFLDRPTSHKVAFWLGSLGFISFLFWQYSYSAKLKEHKSLTEKIESQNIQIAQETRLARNLGKYSKEVKDLDAKLKVVLEELPDSRQIPDLLSSISNLVTDAGLQPSLFKPNPENRREFYAEVPVSVSVDGTFHQVATFFDEVGQLPRIVNINQITVRDPKVTDSGVEIKADCVITAFRSLDESERLKGPEDGGDKGKRKRKK